MVSVQFGELSALIFQVSLSPSPLGEKAGGKPKVPLATIVISACAVHPFAPVPVTE
jgi:hypothetical protein